MEKKIEAYVVVASLGSFNRYGNVMAAFEAASAADLTAKQAVGILNGTHTLHGNSEIGFTVEAVPAHIFEP